MSFHNAMEEEMVKLAEEMSLLEEFPELAFNRHNLQDTTDRLRVYEEIVDDIGVKDFEETEGEAPMSDAQVRSLFFGNEGEDYIHRPSAMSTRAEKASSRRVSERLLLGRVSTRGREQKIKDTVLAICRSLRWYQDKIVNEISTTSEGGELATLLELNDRVSKVLSKADLIAQNEYPMDGFNSHQSYVDLLSPSLHVANSRIDLSAEEGGNAFPSLVSAVCAVRRGGSREEISAAVEHLIRIGNFSGVVSLPAVKQMTAAGALQALLSTLSLASDWPEVELQISKVISVLVTHEDDWTLLQRSAMVILTSLYTLQLKTQTRARTISEALFQKATETEDKLSLDTSLNEDASLANDQQSQDVRALIAAAVAKLSLVLSSDWSVQQFPFGDLSQLGTNASSIQMQMQMASAFSPNKPGKYRSSSKGKASEGSNKTTDANRVLEILLNLILTICEASLSNVNIFQAHEVNEGMFSIPKSASLQSLSLIRQTSKDLSVEGQQFSRRPSLAGIGADSDQFFRDYFGMTRDQLLSGKLGDVKCPVDRSIVLCSSALATLAEVPQCRPGLVAGGALIVIKSWLEMGCLVLENLRSFCLLDLNVELDDCVFQSRFISLFTPTFDLISNATAALMYMTGGTDGRYSSMTNSTSNLLGGGRDYVVGWIDSQILAEGLPEILVRLVLSSNESFINIEPKKAARSVLPSVIGMYIAQTLYQLCSRAQNRQRLQGNVIPFAMCLIFESAAEQVKRVIHHDRQEAAAESKETSHTDVFRVIFQYGGVNTGGQTPNSTGATLHSDKLSEDHSGNSFAARAPSLVRPSSIHRSQSDSSPGYGSAESVMFAVVSSITASCLDAITYFFADEIMKNQFNTPGNTLLLTTAGTHHNQHPSIPKTPLIEIMCHPRVIAAISLATSYLPKGHGRLSCVRIINSLTEWPQSLAALYEGSVMDVLVWISSEADDAQAIPVSHKVHKEEAYPPFSMKPMHMERGVSNGSTISAISSSNHSAPQRHKESSRDLTTPLAFMSGVDEELEEEEESKMALEETLTVCSALANLCEANQVYAARMFSCGLFTIMTRLAKSTHLEITRQAIRSLHAMCKVIALHSEDQKFAHTKQVGKNDYLLQALEVLSSNIKSVSALVQRGAIATIAELACIGVEIRDRIVEGCLRSIVSILVDPGNDREVRSAAEDVLKNIGFMGGIKDFETCSFDFEILKDWYSVYRSLKPQEEGLHILKDWIYRLFAEEEEVSDKRLVLQSSYGDHDDVFNLMNEAANVLHTPVVKSDRPAYLRELEGNHPHGPMSLSIPTIQRHLTDSFMRFLPFCTPKHLFSDSSQHNEDHDGMRSHSREQSSPPSHHMHRGHTYNIYHSWDNYRWIDRPPITVTYLLDLFYSSKVHQLLLTDLTSLGVCVAVNDGEEYSFLIPKPHPVHAVLLPARSYQSFTRVGRVVQRLFEYAGNNKLWALSFHESDYQGDFHTSLLATIQRCPQICSLSFSSNERVEEDALLGHLVGHIPSNIRFVSFKSTLSKESVQAMCILLRSHNEAFLATIDYEDEKASNKPQSGKETSAKAAPPNEKEPYSKPSSYINPHKGLLGLALTHLNFDQGELEHVIDLLHFKPLVKNPSFVNKGTTTPSGKAKSGSEAQTPPRGSEKAFGTIATPRTPISNSGKVEVRGLRYLDLSHNKLSDSQCASILLAALQGPLEGLELGGNSIYKAQKFSDVMDSFSAEKFAVHSNKLRYLGLSHNNLTHKAISSILHKIFSNTSLTSLDLSANNIESTSHTNELLRCFLKRNTGLRVLDLSYNKLNQESCREIELGLLENDTLLLMPLAGNVQIEFSKTIELIQRKLRENRLLYKAQSKGQGEGFSREGVAYPTEDMRGRISLDFVDEEVGAESVLAEATVISGVMDDRAETKPDIIQIEKQEDMTSHVHLPHLINPISQAKEPKPLAIATPIASGDSLLSTPAAHSVVSNSHTISNSTGSVSNVTLGLAEPKNREKAELEYKPELKIDHLEPSIIVPSVIPTEHRANGRNNTLHVLFSAPLAGYDRNGKAHPLEVLDYSTERDTLIQVFREVHRDVAVHFDFATTDSLRTVLSFGCQALHFSGHGIPNGLCFEDGRAGLQVVKVQQLKDLLGAGGLTLDFVFVSACFSKEIGQAFVKAGVPHVVCVKVDSKIQDAAAIAFTRAFYVALLSGRSVKASFDIAKEALKASPYVPNSLLEGEKFILLPDLSEVGDPMYHSKSIFTAKQVGDWPAAMQCTQGPNQVNYELALSRNHLPSPPADFEGREAVMNVLIRYIMDRRLVSLVGEDGLGKTSVAAAVCKYLYDREVFKDNILYVKAKGVKSFSVFLQNVKNGLVALGSPSVSKKIAEAAANSTANSNMNQLIYEEELLISCLSPLKMLLVFDSLDDLLGDYNDNVTEMRLFLSRLFEESSTIKILNVSVDTLSMKNISIGYNTIEYSVHLGPLTLHSSLRLFARLTPCLSTVHEKNAFIDALLPHKHLNPHHSREMQGVGLQLLELVGQGNPSRIVHLACDSSAESVEQLRERGVRIIWQAVPLDGMVQIGPAGAGTGTGAGTGAGTGGLGVGLGLGGTVGGLGSSVQGI